MKILDKIKRTGLLLAVISVFVTSCNKLELNPTSVPRPEDGTTPTLATLLDDPGFSLLKAAVVKAGVLPTLSATSLRFTIFAPDDAAITASLTPILPPGVTPAMYIASLDAASAMALVQYHIIPQVITSGSIPMSFPNFQYPTTFNPLAADPSAALFRLTTYPSVRSNGAWVNNVPIIATNIQAVNGVLHKVAAIIAPPSIDLWSKIQSDPGLTYFKAAIARADNGVPAGQRLQDALSVAANSSAIGANLTIFAPTDDAMKMFVIGALTQAFIAQNFPPATAQAQATTLVSGYGSLILSDPASIPTYGPALAAVVTPTLAKGIVVYHILSSQSGSFAPPGIRVFSVNMPTTATAVKTLLNSGGGPYAAHPGVTIQATFISPFPGISIVSAATVKGIANATASNIIIGSTTSDLHYLNGVIHKIDQVLLPQ